MRLLQQTVGDGGNTAVSPYSLYAALGMLQNGARGETRAQILTALQSRGMAPAQLDRGLAGLRQALRSAAGHAGLTLDSANSLWQQRGLPLHPHFLRALARYYDAGVWQTDFSTPGATRAINRWTSRATHGKIPKLFDELPANTGLVLANALYLHAAWATPFDPHATESRAFAKPGGATVKAKFMSRPTGLPTATGGGYQAAQLPYRGGRFAALTVMPTRGSLPDFIAHLTPAELQRIAGAVSDGGSDGGVALPRFTTTTDTDLKPVLEQLGMRRPFTDRADFTALSPARMAVDQVRQRVYLGVGEKGTTAAAATGSSMRILARPIAPPNQLVFDHPFLFLVRDTQTGAVLFASAITNPKAG